MTKGPIALFYGDAAIIPLLSPEPAGYHFSIASVASVTFLLFIFLFKTLILRKIPTQQKLKELVVSNFLNVFSLLLILVTVSCLTVLLLFHHNTIRENSSLPGEGTGKAPQDYWVDLLVYALVETIFQGIPFVSNQALR